MIRLLVKLGKWLEVRFPAKVIVLEADYSALKAKVEALESIIVSHAELVSRIGVIESSAVHKGAVADLVKVVSEIKTDMASFKTSLGFRSQAANDEISALLNGVPISNE